MTTPATAQPAAVAAAHCYLTAADSMLRGHGPVGSAAVSEGWWPKACACLIRLALETAIDAYWQRMNPAVAQYGSGRTKLLLLRNRCERTLTRQATFAWTTLSRAAHHHYYETAPSVTELRHLHGSVLDILARL
ncbi:hypothetical protein Cme02nite_55700 [Catellatospora methionotrophica]|uniref:Uncharacterized protein n=1 Tax=Catellatospora methionotrophica TaxID=121620 RepID=A0A8J3PIB0_9ACTN|nr:hypothetical protein [Catellatospora methionotrophica]GIG17238.1 hypothetical protein Cme02nite_55700 [Catellatospora methionotrophica]